MYKIVIEYNIWNLESAVNEALKDGYIPIGNLVIEPYGDDTSYRYIQPMCKIEVTLQ